MKTEIRIAILLLTMLGTLAGSRLSMAKDDAAKEDAAPKKKSAAGDDLFGTTKIWQLDLEVTAENWERMQPAGGGRFPGFGQPPAASPPAKPGEKPADTHRSVFGTEFPWVPGTLVAEGRTYSGVGLRFKGNSSYMSAARGPKRPMKVDLDRYAKNQRFHGEKKLNLNNNAMDPSQLRETMSYAVFRAGGVPAPRTALVELTLNVPGKYDHEYLGLYTLVEQVDKKFLSHHFADGKGLLMKPERMRGLDYHGEDWAKYSGQYQPNEDASEAEAQRCMSLAKLINQGTDEEFNKEIGSYLDVDKFLRFIAINAMLSNFDSFLTTGHNYYMYLDPASKKFVFIPWDLNIAMAGVNMFGATDQQMDLSLEHPHSGQNKLIDRLMAIPEVKESYRKLLPELAANCFAKDKLLAQVAELEVATKEILAKEAKAVAARARGAPPQQGFGPGGPGGFGPGGPGGFGGQSPALAMFIERRTASIADQLSGKSKGYVPAGMPFGPGGPGLGNLARPLLTALDGNKDGKLTHAELVAGAEKFLSDFDKNGDGALDERELQSAINSLQPQPGAGGPFGQRPGGAPRPEPR